VTPIFNWLLPPRSALDISTVALAAAVVAVIAVPLTLNRSVRLLAEGGRDAAKAAIEPVAVAALFALAPPLLAFALYFCGWHSTRHIIELANQLDDPEERPGLVRFVQASAPLTVVTLIVAGLAAGALLSTGFPVDESIARVVFIGLSALTLPHVLLLAASRLTVEATARSVSLSEVVVDRQP
jgi:Brp/Blh family beta-carotene 15,15'-monooxygenase